MSMYDIVERNGQTIVVDHFTGQPIPEDEQACIVGTLRKAEQEKIIPGEKISPTQTQDKQA